MTRAKLLSGAVITLIALGVVTWGALPKRADAQPYPYPYPYTCPYGYYFDPAYGCLPLNYFYGPPTYVYPGLSFGFFYGGRWDHRWHDGHPHGAPLRAGRHR